MAGECPVIGLLRRPDAVAGVDVVAEKPAVRRIEVHIPSQGCSKIRIYWYIGGADHAPTRQDEIGRTGEGSRAVGRVYADEEFRTSYRVRLCICERDRKEGVVGYGVGLKYDVLAVEAVGEGAG